MIVVTGPGRSGTSVLAAVYLELGFDPGGAWDESGRMGYEAGEIVRANFEIIEGLGMASTARAIRFAPDRRVPPRMKRAAKLAVPQAIREKVVWAFKDPPRSRSRRSRIQGAEWNRFDRVVSRVGPQLVALARDRQVAKDPRFLWTLPVWLAAGAPIEHVVLTLRSLEMSVKRRVDQGWIPDRSTCLARNWLAYGLGLCVDAVNQYRVSYAVLRFPEFLEEPDSLFDALRFPEPISRQRFDEAVRTVVRPELVRGKG